jgi:hypothetical protein
MARGIEGTNIFRRDEDRNDFLDRLAVQCEAEALKVYALTLIPNHFHLVLRTGNRSLFEKEGKGAGFNLNVLEISKSKT